MNLTVDIGNSLAKLTVLDGGTPVACRRARGDGFREALSEVLDGRTPEGCAFACVGREEALFAEALAGLPCPLLRVTGTTPSPLVNRYRTPGTLGADRLAAAVGAAELRPQADLLIIDAGTCIKYDVVDAARNYWGGNISPGLEMRLRALHEYTARLPKVEAEGELPDVGHDTETAIRAGVVRGIRFEVEGYLRQMAERYPSLQVFLTGGDGLGIESPAGVPVLRDAHLVARGLDRLLRDWLTQ